MVLERPPLHVLHVLAFDAVGGTESSVARLAADLAGRGVRSTVVTLAGSDGRVDELVAGSGARHVSLGATSPAAAVRELGRVLRGARPDVLCAYGFGPSVLARLLARTTSPRPAVVVGVRGETVVDPVNVGRRRIAHAGERVGWPLVDVYDANSAGGAAAVRRLGVPGSRVVVIPNGIDVERWSPVPAADRDGRDTLWVVCVARLSAVKGHATLLRAARGARDGGVPVELVLVGEGALRHELEELARELGIASSVRMVGSASPGAVLDELRRADAFALLSSSEGLPGSVLEAMAVGLPVVGTRVNGIVDLVVEGETGVLVEVGDVAAVRDALVGLWEDRARAATLGAHGRRRAVERFSAESCLQAKHALYARLAAARAARSSS